MRRSRLNLVFLRGALISERHKLNIQEDLATQSPDLKLTRRTLLKLSGLAASGPLGAGLLPASQEPLFKFFYKHGRAVFRLGERDAWMIDPRRFAGKPRLRVHQDRRLIHLRLVEARFPGTNLPADLDCQCRSRGSGWEIHLRLQFGGFQATGRLMPWLSGQEDLRSRVWLSEQALHTSSGEPRLDLAGVAEAAFSPDWKLRLQGERFALACLEGTGLGCNILEILLAEPTASSLTDRPCSKRTFIDLERGSHDWQWWPAMRKVRGGTLIATGSPFDRLRIEAGESAGRVQIASLATADGASRLAFQPGAAYLDCGGNPFVLPLADVRYAALFEPSGTESALLAGLAGEPSWLHAGGCSVLLGDPSDDLAFELHARDGRIEDLKCAPTVVATLIPVAGAVTEAAVPPQPTRLAFIETAAEVLPVTAGACGHVSPCTGPDSLEVCLPECCVPVVRPEDLLVLCFEFKNLRLRTGRFRKPTLERCGPGEAYMIVHFPPQHVAERAFFETLQDVQPDPPLPPPVESRISGPSRLGFRLLPGINEIPFTLESMLNWDQFQPELVPARRCGEDIKEPQAIQTAIEVPFRLFLSPEVNARWLHSSRPVVRNGRTELWHTRLISADDPRRAPNVIAVWSPALKEPDCSLFNMSLTERDRRDIVRLSHDADTGPAPVSAENFMLSALGAWTDLKGRWDRTPQRAALSLEKWEHVISMGRDQHVVIARRGFLYPFGHKAVLITETERKIHMLPPQPGTPPAFVAYLRQRKYIVVKEKEKEYDFFNLPFRSIRFEETTSPLLDLPITGIPRTAGGTWCEHVFWPMVRNELHRFRLSGVDKVASRKHFQAPVIFVEDVSRATPDPLCADRPSSPVDCPPGYSIAAACDDIRNEYTARQDRRQVDLQGQTISIANSFRKGDTEIEGLILEFEACWLEPPVEQDPTNGDADPRAAMPCVDAGCGTRESEASSPFRPLAAAIQARLPALDHLLADGGGAAWLKPDDPDEASNVAEVFAMVLLDRTNTLAAPFDQQSQRSGGALAPTPKITHLSRRFGPVGGKPSGGTNASPAFSPKDFFLTRRDDPNRFANILGRISIAEILQETALDPTQAGAVPAVLSLLTEYADGPDHLEQSIEWNTEALTDAPFGPLTFLARSGGKSASLSINGRFEAWLGIEEPPRFQMNGTLQNFGVKLDFGIAGILVSFQHLRYSARSDGKTDFDIQIAGVELLGALAFVQELTRYMRQFLAEAGIDIELQPTGLIVRLPQIKVPQVSVGVFSLQNLVITNRCELSFTGGPIVFTFEFARPDSPFLLNVGPFAGGGFITLQVDSTDGGIRHMAAALEFGAMKDISFGSIAHGRLYVMGGLYYEMENRGFRAVNYRAYVRAGGELHALGLISLSVDLYVGLEARENGVESYLFGRATLTHSFKIGFVKKSFSITYEQRFAGSRRTAGGRNVGFLRDSLTEHVLLHAADMSEQPDRSGEAPRFEDVMTEPDWQCYWNAFAPDLQGSETSWT